MQKLEELWIKGWFDGDYSEVAGTKRLSGPDKEEVGIQVLRGKLTALEVLTQAPEFASNSSILRQDVIQQVNIHSEENKVWSTAIYDVRIVEWEEDSTSGILTGQGRRVGRIVGLIYGKVRKDETAPQASAQNLSSLDIASQVAARTYTEQQASQAHNPISPKADRGDIRCLLCHWMIPLILGSIVWFFCTWWWSLLTVAPLIIRCLLVRQEISFLTPPLKNALLEAFLVMAISLGALGFVIWTVFESCTETPYFALVVLCLAVVIGARLRQCGIIWLVTAFWFFAMLLTCTGQDYDCLAADKKLPDVGGLSSPNLRMPNISSLPSFKEPGLPDLPEGSSDSQGQKKSDQTKEVDGSSRGPEVGISDAPNNSNNRPSEPSKKSSTADFSPSDSLNDTDKLGATDPEKLKGKGANYPLPSQETSRRDQSGQKLPNQQKTIDPKDQPTSQDRYRANRHPMSDADEQQNEPTRKTVTDDVEAAEVTDERPTGQALEELPGKFLNRLGELWQDFVGALNRSFEPDREAKDMSELSSSSDSWSRIGIDDAERNAEQVFGCKEGQAKAGPPQVIYLGEGTLFDLNQATLSTEADKQIVRLARMINRYPSSNIMVIGHADKTPHKDGAVGNLQLSELRAQAVVNRLIELGQVAPNRTTAFGVGARYPIVDTPDPFRGNRRVEVRIICSSPTT
jgi:outer membrane protein OmpA-like peptidoglycan-associated protein